MGSRRKVPMGSRRRIPPETGADRFGKGGHLVTAFDTRALGSWEQNVASLAGMLVHEVKNPLSTLSISTQLLLEDSTEPESPRQQRARRRLEVMRGEIARIEQIVDSFLHYTRLQVVEDGEVDLDRLLQELLSDNSEGLEQKGIRFHFQPNKGQVPIAGDAGLLRQAFLNLLRNAEQAMPEGGELIVRCRQEDGAEGALAVVELTDTGVGIPAEQLPRIFRPYFSSKEGGTGLGLPTTLQIVRLHGGNIRVESEAGQGSRFIVELPVVKGGVKGER
ncbi:MAG TPA: HAMP domain-containing histidine kinase, partial [Planctomycetes bacterium]|nr:HAMP domain-containing histidine kinase [Planctomycetota bacterium]